MQRRVRRPVRAEGLPEIDEGSSQAQMAQSSKRPLSIHPMPPYHPAFLPVTMSFFLLRWEPSQATSVSPHTTSSGGPAARRSTPPLPVPPQVGLLREAALKFRNLQMLLLRRLHDNLQHQGGDESVPVRERLLLLHDILDHGRHRPSAAAATSAGSGGDSQAHQHPHHGHGEKGDEALVTLSDMCPLRVAFEARDAKFMAAPVVEVYTRLSWLGMEFVMETAKDGMRSLSVLDPSFGFVALCNLGLCSRQSGSLEFTMRLWHYHVWSSQVSVCMGGYRMCLRHYHVWSSQASIQPCLGVA